GGAGAALPIGIGAVTSKAIAGIAVTAILAGGAVEAQRVTTHDPQKAVHAPVTAPSPAPPAQAEPTGGTAISDVPPALVEKPKPATEADKTDKQSTDQAGTTGPEGVGTTGSGGVVDPAKSDNPAPTAPGV